MPAATVESVRELVAGFARLNGGPDDEDNPLEAFWEGLITRGTAKAEAQLRDALSGFSGAAVAKWPLFEHYHRDLSAYWAVTYSNVALTDNQMAQLEKLNCLAEVRAVESIGDDPDDESDDLVLGGRMERDDDLFRTPAVNSDGSLAGIFNTPTAWTHSR